MPILPDPKSEIDGIVSFRTRAGELPEMVEVRVDDASLTQDNDPPIAVGWVIHKETARTWAKLLLSAADKRDVLDAPIPATTNGASS